MGVFLRRVAHDDAGLGLPHARGGVSLDRICSARSMREAKRAGGATMTALKPLTRPLYAAPPTAEQPECPECGGNGAGGPHEEDCSLANQPECVTCSGHGLVGNRLDDGEECPECHGAGIIFGTECSACRDLGAEIAALRAGKSYCGACSSGCAQCEVAQGSPGVDQPDTVAVPREHPEDVLIDNASAVWCYREDREVQFPSAADSDLTVVPYESPVWWAFYLESQR